MSNFRCPQSGRSAPIPGHNQARRGAYTLVEILIVVAIAGALLAVALPAWAKTRKTARIRTCVNNLRDIYAAKVQWATEFNQSQAALPTGDNLLPYLRGHVMPACPTAGTYQIRHVAEYPLCAYFAVGHALNSENLYEHLTSE
jgi:prepilin-type N-terminal cleavage/methylation domain-containing protein